MKSLIALIKEKNLDYVNSNITKDNFPAPKELRTDYKLFHFDQYISSEDAIKEMEKEGYAPANLYELLAYDWNGEDWVVALGSSTQVNGDRDVPYLSRRGAERDLDLGWFVSDWYGDYRFLAVRNSVSSTSESALSPSDTLALAVEQVKAAGYKVIKEM